MHHATRRKGRMITAFVIAGGVTLVAFQPGVTAAAKRTTTTKTKATTKRIKTGVVKMGAIVSQSGTFAMLGAGVTHGLQLAVKQINDAGGFDIGTARYTIDLKILDDRSDPSIAVANARQLIDDDGIKILFGPHVSGQALPVAQLALPRGVLMVANASDLLRLLSIEAVDTTSSTLFVTQVNTTPRAQMQIAGLLHFAPNLKKLGLLTADDPSANGVRDGLTAAAAKAGVTIAGEETFPATATDFSAQLNRLKGAGVDVLAVCCTELTTSGAIRQGIELNVAPAYATFSVSVDVALRGATGSPLPVPYIANGNPATIDRLSDGSVVAPRPGVQKYIADLKSVLAQSPGVQESQALFVYDFVGMVVQAMKTAGTVNDVSKISRALETQKYAGALGSLRFDALHTAQFGLDECQVAAGKVDCYSIPFLTN